MSYLTEHITKKTITEKIGAIINHIYWLKKRDTNNPELIQKLIFNWRSEVAKLRRDLKKVG